MNNLVTIKCNQKNKIEDKVYDYLNPDYIYIPIKNGFSLAVNTNSEIYKEQVLLKKENEFIYSPISGVVLGKTVSVKLNNNIAECIVIENDFREKTRKKKGTLRYINEYSKEDVIKITSKYNAIDFKLEDNYKYILVNGIDIDPYEKTSSYIINVHSSKILEAIDALATIFETSGTIFAINNNDSSNVLNLSNNIGTYPNITLKLMPDVYPIGFEKVLIKNIFGNKVERSDILYLTVHDVYNIYNVLKRKKPITERFITLSGETIDNPKVVNVKIGTTIEDLIKNCCMINNPKYNIVINGLIAGKTLSTANNIISSDTRSVFLSLKDSSEEKKCINCGLCNLKCPANLNPKYLMEHKKADRRKCIGCGLCTYVCPSKINFKPYLGGKND